jgi:hypothetical protein
MKHHTKRWNLAVSTLIGALVLTAIFLPDLVGFGWHAVHGPDAEYRGLQIPVPSGWFATRRGESLTMERMLHFPVRQLTPTVVFLPMHIAKEMVFNPNVWADVQIDLQKRRGYRLVSTRDVQIDGQTGYCWEFVHQKDDSRWWITCLMPADRLSADFSGQHSYASAFYSILPGITRRPGSI